jgi:hypothetical protein
MTPASRYQTALSILTMRFGESDEYQSRRLFNIGKVLWLNVGMCMNHVLSLLNELLSWQLLSQSN